MDIKLKGLWINNLRNADNTVVIDSSEQDLEQMLDVVNTESKTWCLRINKNKPKLIEKSCTLGTSESNIWKLK